MHSTEIEQSFVNSIQSKGEVRENPGTIGAHAGLSDNKAELPSIMQGSSRDVGGQ